MDTYGSREEMNVMAMTAENVSTSKETNKERG